MSDRIKLTEWTDIVVPRLPFRVDVEERLVSGPARRILIEPEHQWCRTEFGPALSINRFFVNVGKPFRLRAGARWDFSGFMFFFKSEEDAFMFRMHWG